ncbi:hypothetical protein FIBSPDRAFT_882341 [Athelia psychrophila]|uniref:Uncharacterized protein n=1 Tax=Athelia psychrophila TaxID=1759441 RepID=A0A166V8U6_9AGAM|nr:hypothetical protein FIBSPDRAFT_882341 [Fibularhizoctonia sp. CBS 109695]
MTHPNTSSIKILTFKWAKADDAKNEERSTDTPMMSNNLHIWNIHIGYGCKGLVVRRWMTSPRAAQEVRDHEHNGGGARSTLCPYFGACFIEGKILLIAKPLSGGYAHAEGGKIQPGAVDLVSRPSHIQDGGMVKHEIAMYDLHLARKKFHPSGSKTLRAVGNVG